MSHFRNLLKTLLSVLFIVNLNISYDYISSQESLATCHPIELLLSPYENDAIDVIQFKTSFLPYKSLVSYEEYQKFDYLINNQNSSEQLKFKFQNDNVLSFKSMLLQIVINEITILKSHCS